VSSGAPAAYDRSVTAAVLTEPDLRGPFPPVPGPGRAPVPELTRRRLAPPMPSDGWLSWIPTVLITGVAAIIHLIGLSRPKGMIFDEIYYATEGQDLIHHGVEWNHANNVGDFVVHPPLGKWLIGWGQAIFGESEFGWRIASAVFGTLAVLVIIRLGRRMFRSTVLGCAAGLLMTLDGLEFVLSRTALLDIFLMFFILASFACLVLDRDQRRRRWLRALEAGVDPARGERPEFAVPWWRLGGAVMIGCAMSVKWSALWYIVMFGVLVFVWEVGARRSAGVRHPWLDALRGEIGWLVLCGGIVLGVYLASWTGWFVTDTGYDRHWLAHSGKTELPFIGALQNLYHYHQEALHFHNGLNAKHSYQSWPWQWLLLGRPVAFYWSNAGPCGAATCAGEVLLLGTPILWWAFIPALAGLAWFGISRRDWRALAIGLGVVVGIVPWFAWELDDRTMFYFYVLPAEPFLILGLVYVLGALIRRPDPAGASRAAGGTELLDPVDRRIMGVIFAGAFVFAVAIIFAYFYPIYVGSTISYDGWLARMWLGNRWI
jgi:dolichyl-phosphate-mannose--protein O-mannosyl transferase